MSATCELRVRRIRAELARCMMVLAKVATEYRCMPSQRHVLIDAFRTGAHQSVPIEAIDLQRSRDSCPLAAAGR